MYWSSGPQRAAVTFGSFTGTDKIGSFEAKSKKKKIDWVSIEEPTSKNKSADNLQFTTITYAGIRKTNHLYTLNSNEYMM